MSHIPPAIARDMDFRARCQEQLRQVDLQLSKCQALMRDLSIVAARQTKINTHYPPISNVQNGKPEFNGYKSKPVTKKSVPKLVPRKMPQSKSPWRCNYTLYPIPEEDTDFDLDD